MPHRDRFPIVRRPQRPIRVAVDRGFASVSRAVACVEILLDRCVVSRVARCVGATTPRPRVRWFAERLTLPIRAEPVG